MSKLKRAVQVERHLSFIAFRGLKGPLASLGNWIAIENKTHRVHGGLSESIESPVILKPLNKSCLNAAEMRQTLRLDRWHARTFAKLESKAAPQIGRYRERLLTRSRLWLTEKGTHRYEIKRSSRHEAIDLIDSTALTVPPRGNLPLCRNSFEWPYQCRLTVGWT